jgi:hypothetical protein
MHWIPPLGESPGDPFIRVVRESGKNIRTAPLTTPFTHSVQSQGHYSHFTLLTTLHRTYHMATHVPYGQASVHHASPISGPLRTPLPSLSRMLNDGLRLHECLMHLFRSCARCPVSNHKI